MHFHLLVIFSFFFALFGTIISHAFNFRFFFPMIRMIFWAWWYLCFVIFFSGLVIFFFFLSFLKVILVNCFVGGLKLIDWCEGRHGKAILDQSWRKLLQLQALPNTFCPCWWYHFQGFLLLLLLLLLLLFFSFSLRHEFDDILVPDCTIVFSFNSGFLLDNHVIQGLLWYFKLWLQSRLQLLCDYCDW